MAHFTARPGELAWRAEEVFGWARDVISVQIAGRYPLADASRAQQDLASRSLAGKLLIDIASPARALTLSPVHLRARTDAPLSIETSFPDMATGPLTDIVVLDLSRALAGPIAAMMLGDLGARVIKIESPVTGDDSRGWARHTSGHPAIRTPPTSCRPIETKNPSNWT